MTTAPHAGRTGLGKAFIDGGNVELAHPGSSIKPRVLN